ncbi:RICIN domain-containing protein [Xanthovirga aplysinae]|uniref:RICIN domain-containing protein n=1 Tax=Xanthovirga aplysinae TaxID=2529853 RepID=UPI0012BC6F66|nr:RICIN domain-containing protein [Xanthovirga aplysinae]MTI33311.1 T9SS type A sorting domain-containing protein [Xanthovirga aplysinae]
MNLVKFYCTIVIILFLCQKSWAQADYEGIPLKNIEESFKMLADYENGKLTSAEYKVTNTKAVGIGLLDPIVLHLQSATKYKDCIYWIHSEFKGTRSFMVVAQRKDGKYNVKKVKLPRFMNSSCGDGNEVNHPSNMQLIGKFLMISIEAEYNPLSSSYRDRHHMFIFYDLSDPYNPVRLPTRIEDCSSNTYGGGIAYHPILERYFVVTSGGKVYKSNAYKLGDSKLAFEKIGNLSSTSGIKVSAGNNLLAQEDGNLYSVAFNGNDSHNDNRLHLRKVINAEGEIEMGNKITYNLGKRNGTHFRWGASMVVHSPESFTIMANERELHSGGFSDYSRIREWPVDPALPYPGRTYRIRPKCKAAEDFSLQVWAGSSSNGKNIQMQSKYEDWEYWKVVRSSDKQGYLLKNAHTGRFISVKDKSTKNYATVHQWKDDNKNDDNNTLRFEPLGNGFFVLRFRHSNRALAIQGSCSDIARQTNVRQEEYRGWNDMKWEFVRENMSSRSALLSGKEANVEENEFSLESGLSISPNPSSSEMLISYVIEKDVLATIKILDINGKLLFETQQEAWAGQENHFHWKGQKNNGNPLPKGIYLCLVQAGNERFMKRIVRY